jgi:uncharacterized protein
MRIPGAYTRDKIPHFLRQFAPIANLHRLYEVDLDDLWKKGKRLILMDVDNTLLPWKSVDIPPESRAWVEKAQAIGFSMCIVSNTRHPERLKKLCESLKVDYVLARMKPSRQMFTMAMARHKSTPQATVMIGDQLMTDILGANRAGIDAIWVTPMSDLEFAGTKLNRMVEFLIGKFLFRYFQPSVAYGVKAEKAGLFKHQVVGEFAKFAVIGGLSTMIDIGIHYLLMFQVRVGDRLLSEIVGARVLDIFNPAAPHTPDTFSDAAYAPLKIVPVLLAIFNGYFWNSRWTFRLAEKRIQGRLVAKFYIVALFAMVVNLVVSTTVKHMAHVPPEQGFAMASAAGLVVAAFVNFFGQREWTFRDEKRR